MIFTDLSNATKKLWVKILFYKHFMEARGRFCVIRVQSLIFANSIFKIDF